MRAWMLTPEQKRTLPWFSSPHAGGPDPNVLLELVELGLLVVGAHNCLCRTGEGEAVCQELLLVQSEP